MDVSEVDNKSKIRLNVYRAPGPVIRIAVGSRNSSSRGLHPVCQSTQNGEGSLVLSFLQVAELKLSSLPEAHSAGAQMASGQARNAEEAGGISVETGSGMQAVASWGCDFYLKQDSV